MNPLNLDWNKSYSLSPLFQLKKDGTSFMLENVDTKGVIATDEIGFQLLQQLPGTIHKANEKLEAIGHRLPLALIEFYVTLFRLAGVINKKITSTEFPKITTGTKHTTESRCTTLPDAAQKSVVSVVIVTRNSERFIIKNLDSLHHQTEKPQEIIVVDNDSTDNTLTWTREKYPDVQCLPMKQNLHYALAVNTGVLETTGDLLLILNDDIELEPDFLQNLRVIYQNCEPETAAISPVIRFNKLRPFVNSVGNMLLKGNWGADNFMGVLDLGQFGGIETLNSACFGAVAIPKTAWQMIGPMDHGFKFYDDIDWCFRAHRAGLNIKLAPQLIAYHQFGGTYPTGMKLSFIVKSRLRFVIKHFSFKYMVQYAASYTWRDLRNSLFFLKKGQFRNLFANLKGYALLLVELPGLIFYRWRRGVVEAERVKTFEEKTPPPTILVNGKNDPLITRGTIENYYDKLPPHFLTKFYEKAPEPKG